ncbi:DNA polymerase II [Colwellia sp. 1_MG-2023]|uniref:DNA polymerase II n=1 Tax=Colwellia sp. 1_MG-2023 TaxID=3062649 RepID=UPI0026E1EF98|nr:DNA polymerase II [Colwellia sp. 1_MG-2023]MDO6447244.1 DNA polymerase II [Colwellia sp. 1_MG-2023]
MTISSTNTSASQLSGFILTRQAYDTKQGIELSFWLKTQQGVQNFLVKHEKAVFFIEAKDQDNASHLLTKNDVVIEDIKPVPLKTFAQLPVVAIYFATMRAFYRGRDLLKAHDVKCYEDDFRPEERYLMERFITASAQFSLTDTQELTEQLRKINFPVHLVNKSRAIPAEQTLDAISLSMVSLDIECSMKGELYSIGLYSENLNNKVLKKVLMIGDQNILAPSKKLNAKQVADIEEDVVWLKDEPALLTALIAWIQENDPDVFIGWNVIQFDFALLQKRCDIHGINFTIGRDGRVPRWRKNKTSEQQFIDVNGRIILDGIDLLKTATYNFPSFSLDYVARELLGLHKQVDDVDNRVKEITENFHHDKLALAAYNLEDCRLVTLIFNKTQLLEFAMLRAQLTGLTVDRIGGSVAAFTNLYLPKLHRAGYVAPNMGDGLKGLVSPGGYVMDSIPGLYKNVLVLDFKSLYPSIIRSFNIDPMGMIEGLKSPHNAIPGFDGAYFSREQHFLPDIINQLWLERDKAKKEKNAALSQAIKIIMNSFYGILGSTGCRFFDPRLSGSITKRSHELLKVTKTWIEDKGYKVIYGDTDSIFVHVGNEKSAKECQQLGESLQDFINAKWQDKLYTDFAIESQLEIEFETHFCQFFMPTIRGLDVGTKKRYAGVVLKNGEEQLIFKGLESVRTDWTELAKKFQRELYLKVFNGEEVKDYVIDIVNKTKNGEMDDLLIYRKRIRRKLEQYVKNVPPHIKAARLADDINEKANKPLKFQNKGWIEYYLTTVGPQAKGYVNAPLDYQVYVDKQLSTVADAILPFIGTSFSEITDAQMNLFN